MGLDTEPAQAKADKERIKVAAVQSLHMEFISLLAFLKLQGAPPPLMHDRLDELKRRADNYYKAAIDGG